MFGVSTLSGDLQDFFILQTETLPIKDIPSPCLPPAGAATTPPSVSVILLAFDISYKQNRTLDLAFRDWLIHLA